MGVVVELRLKVLGDWTTLERCELEALADQLQSGAREVIYGVTDAGDPWCAMLDASGEVVLHVARIRGRFLAHAARDNVTVEARDLWTAVARLSGTGPPKPDRPAKGSAEPLPAHVFALFDAVDPDIPGPRGPGLGGGLAEPANEPIPFRPSAANLDGPGGWSGPASPQPTAAGPQGFAPAVLDAAGPTTSFHAEAAPALETPLRPAPDGRSIILHAPTEAAPAELAPPAAVDAPQSLVAEAQAQTDPMAKPVAPLEAGALSQPPSLETPFSEAVHPAAAPAPVSQIDLLVGESGGGHFLLAGQATADGASFGATVEFGANGARVGFGAGGPSEVGAVVHSGGSGFPSITTGEIVGSAGAGEGASTAADGAAQGAPHAAQSLSLVAPGLDEHHHHHQYDDAPQGGDEPGQPIDDLTGGHHDSLF